MGFHAEASADGAVLDIFGMDGVKVATVSRPGMSDIRLADGVYVISSGTGSTKVRVI